MTLYPKLILDALATVRYPGSGKNLVEAEMKALKENRFGDFLDGITSSGNSSWKWLQNCYTNSNVQEQGISIALALPVYKFLKEPLIRKFGQAWYKALEECAEEWKKQREE